MPAERRVYVVDDDEAVRDSLSVLLESKAFAVRSFASALEFLEAAPSLLTGCLIVDIRMPEMDGKDKSVVLEEYATRLVSAEAVHLRERDGAYGDAARTRLERRRIEEEGDSSRRSFRHLPVNRQSAHCNRQ